MATAARYLLDTNICVYIRQRRPAEVLARFETLKVGEAVLSVITWGELLYGVERSPQRERSIEHLKALSSLIPVLPLPQEAAAHYGSVRKTLETRGEIIGNNDLWIAAHALAAGLTLVTNNEREFKRVPKLKVQNWVAST